MKQTISILTILFIATISAVAQVSFSVLPPRQVIAGNKFAVTFRVANGDGTNLKVPQIEGCTFIFGPSTSTMQSYQMINGKTSSSRTTDYTYTYKADKPGKYTIGEASITIDGKRYTTKPVTFTILPPDKSAQSGGSNVRVDDYSTQTSDQSVSANDIFVRIILDKTSVYEQEPILCTIKLYTKYQISSFMATTQPSFDGCLIQEIDLQPSLNDIEHYNGQNYMTAILKKCIIFPQKSGKITINSGKYDISVVQHERFGGFFGGSRPVEKKIKVSSNSATANVKTLPTPQPEGFSGAVGAFSIDSKLSSASFRTNEAASLVYTITGTGNIKYIKEPVIDFPSEFEQYTPKSDIKTSVSGSNVTGSVVVEYTFVPQSVGDFTIGADKFVYFDPNKKQYVTLNTPSYDINVVKGVGTSTSSGSKQDVTTKNRDILHIKIGDKDVKQDHPLFIMKSWYWAIYGLLIIILIVSIYTRKQHLKINADIQGLRLANANKVARRRLKVAKTFMDGHQNDKFNEELIRATWGYLSDKLSIPASQLSRENISTELLAYGVPEELIQKFIYVLDEAEMARYSPSNNDDSMNELYAKASDAMNALANIKSIKR